MLHYKIMSYDSDEEWAQLIELMSLRDAGSIEREFVRRLNSLTQEEPFADELSAKLLEEVDHSRRVGEYAVETPLGKGCITCLATGVKFGLMVIETAKRGRPVITRVGTVGGNVLEWLSKNGDFTLVLTDNECDRSLRRVLMMVTEGFADLEYRGRIYLPSNMRKCMEDLKELLSRDMDGQAVS